MGLCRAVACQFLVVTWFLLLGALAPARSESPLELRVQVACALEQQPLGGVYLRYRCEQTNADVMVRTDAQGQAVIRYGSIETGAGMPSPDQFRWLLPRPNPSGASGVVPFVAPAFKSAVVHRVALYDLRGRRMAVGALIDGELPLPGAGLPAGVYLLASEDPERGHRTTCRITAPGGLRRLELRAQAPSATQETAKLRTQEPIRGTLTARHPGYRDRHIEVEAHHVDEPLTVLLDGLDDHMPVTTWIFGSDHGWNSAAADSGWVAALPDTGLVYHRSVIDTDGTRHRLGQLDALDPSAEYAHDHRIEGRSTTSLTSAGARLPIIHFDIADLPTGVTIKDARLIVSPAPGSAIPCGVGQAHTACLDVWRDDEAWLQAPPSAASVDPEVIEHYRRISWKNADAAGHLPWWPVMDDRTLYDDLGIHSVPQHDAVPDGHACSYDVTRAVQAWSDHREVLANAGFLLCNTTYPTEYAVAAGPGQPAADRQPLLQISFSQAPRTVPWNGHPLAFSFQTDDGDTATAGFAGIMEAHDARLTAFLMRRAVRELDEANNPTKLTMEQCRDLCARGHEIGHHSDRHMPVWGLAEITWGAADSMGTELARDTWLAQVFPDFCDGLHGLEVMAYPNGGVSLWAMKNLVAEGFLMARCCGSGESWQPPAWGNGGHATYLSWYDPVNLFAVAMTADEQLVGAKDHEADLEEIRLRLRRQSGLLLNQGQSVLMTFVHGTKSADYYPRGMHYAELERLLVAIEESGLYWVTTCAELAHCYREAHHAVPPDPAFAPAAFDSLAGSGHHEFDQMWWVPDDH